jgi:hypothetical protein
MWAMEPLSCSECQSIYRELIESSRAARERGREQKAAALPLTTWLEQLDEEECAHTRETSGLWATWRRLQEHRARTGHQDTEATAIRAPGISTRL